MSAVNGLTITFPSRAGETLRRLIALPSQVARMHRLTPGYLVGEFVVGTFHPPSPDCRVMVVRGDPPGIGRYWGLWTSRPWRRSTCEPFTDTGGAVVVDALAFARWRAEQRSMLDCDATGVPSPSL